MKERKKLLFEEFYGMMHAPGQLPKVFLKSRDVKVGRGLLRRRRCNAEVSRTWCSKRPAGVLVVFIMWSCI